MATQAQKNKVAKITKAVDLLQRAKLALPGTSKKAARAIEEIQAGLLETKI